MRTRIKNQEFLWIKWRILPQILSLQTLFTIVYSQIAPHLVDQNLASSPTACLYFGIQYAVDDKVQMACDDLRKYFGYYEYLCTFNETVSIYEWKLVRNTCVYRRIYSLSYNNDENIIAYPGIDLFVQTPKYYGYAEHWELKGVLPLGVYFEYNTGYFKGTPTGLLFNVTEHNNRPPYHDFQQRHTSPEINKQYSYFIYYRQYEYPATCHITYEQYITFRHLQITGQVLSNITVNMYYNNYEDLASSTPLCDYTKIESLLNNTVYSKYNDNSYIYNSAYIKYCQNSEHSNPCNTKYYEDPVLEHYCQNSELNCTQQLYFPITMDIIHYYYNSSYVLYRFCNDPQEQANDDPNFSFCSSFLIESNDHDVFHYYPVTVRVYDNQTALDYSTAMVLKPRGCIPDNGYEFTSPGQFAVKPCENTDIYAGFIFRLCINYDIPAWNSFDYSICFYQQPVIQNYVDVEEETTMKYYVKESTIHQEESKSIINTFAKTKKALTEQEFRQAQQEYEQHQKTSATTLNTLLSSPSTVIGSYDSVLHYKTQYFYVDENPSSDTVYIDLMPIYTGYIEYFYVVPYLPDNVVFDNKTGHLYGSLSSTFQHFTLYIYGYNKDAVSDPYIIDFSSFLQICFSSLDWPSAAANHYAYIPCLNSTINGRARYCRSISISQDSEVGEKREVWSDPIESFCYNSISNQPDQDKAFITIPMTVFASSPCSNS